MKQRILSAAVGLCVLFVVLRFFDTLILNAAVSVISLLALYEMLAATGHIRYRGLSLACFLTAAWIPFLKTSYFVQLRLFPVLVYLLVVVLFCILLAKHETLNFEDVGFAFFVSLFIPLSITTAIYMRDSFGAVLGMFYVLVALGGAWLCDTCAYFSGVAFGKHKMAPKISPKKTVEGAVGGVIGALLLLLGVAYLLSHGFAMLGSPIEVDYLRLALISPLLSLTSMVGDLSASVIKRQCGIKDFGSIMPGHGGVLDRFDSVLFVMPLVYIIAWHLPLAGLA